jgi:tetratricopeptide (TPR) repeat protein
MFENVRIVPNRANLRRAVAAIALLAALCSRATESRADAPPALSVDASSIQPTIEATPNRPWATGITEQNQQAAREKFLQGNALLKDGYFAQAAGQYQEALAIWDHPGIHYNLALALINLDRPLEVREQLRAALRYGAAPIDQDKFDHATSYLKLTEQRLARLDIDCSVEGAAVTLDDQFLFRAPGHYSGFVLPGEHRVRAHRLGFEPTEFRKIFLPGKATELDLKLYTEDQLVHYERRWPLWAPLVVTAAGAATVAAGAVLLVQSNAKLKAFDEGVARQCPNGCDVPSSSLDDERRTGRHYRTASAVTFVGGGLLVAGGAVLTFLNRAVPHRIVPESPERLAVEPTIGSSFAGLVGKATF